MYAAKTPCPDCGGMPRWWVSEPYINVQIADEPLSYFTSGGQQMTFRWIHQQRARLLDDSDLARAYHYVVAPVRVDYQVFSSGHNVYALMTNAAWCHNWWSEVVFWDPSLESVTTAPYSASIDTSVNPNLQYFPMTRNYSGFALLGDGGVVKFDQSTSSSPTSSLKTRVQVLGQMSPTGGPRVPLYLLPQGIQSPVYQTNSDGIVWVDNPQFGFRVLYPDGSQDLYGLVFLDATSSPYRQINNPNQPTPVNTCRALLTQRIDPQGRKTSLGYQKLTPTSGQPPYVVRYVVDCDGRTNTYSYNPANYNQLTQIQDPYGRSASFGYDSASELLTSITDAAGLSSSFTYQPPVTWTTGSGLSAIHYYMYSGWISSLVTRYGTTSFSYYEQKEAGATTEYQQRAVLVSEPESAYQLFLYRHQCQDTEPDYVDASLMPSVPGWTFDNGSLSSPGGLHAQLSYRNTYHWGRRQFANTIQNPSQWLPPYGSIASGLSTLGPADYRKARMRHWLLNSSDAFTITDSASSEREPSRDSAGAMAEPRTWYAYAGQPFQGYFYAGTDPLIGCIARQLPDGSSQYESREHDLVGNLTRQRVSYSRPDGSVGELTNGYAYSGDGVDLLAASNSLGQWAEMGYANHQVIRITNALNQVTQINWDSSSHNLTGFSLPSGLSANLNYYYADPTSPNGSMLQAVSWPATGRSLAFTYSNSLPATISDDRNLTVSLIRDGLNRLTSASFPDHTTISNVYDRLHLGANKDRLGNWTWYGYDGLEHLTSITNALTNVTSFSWCACGALGSITDPLANITTLGYDNQGNLTSILFPDNSSLTYGYDSAGRVTQVTDGASRWISADYNNQGLITTLNNTFGVVESVVYDAVDRPIWVTDANNVTFTNQYDLLNRVVGRTWLADGLGEGYLYATNGLVAYTNRNQRVTWYSRDVAGRLLAVTNANNEVVQFAYNSLNQTTNLLDGRTNSTSWFYNEYGWLTNKLDALGGNASRYAYDANGRVTNRWTPQFGNTSYAYDAVGNLTNVGYPASVISYFYDAAERLKGMADATGVTSFSYTAASQLQTENGPWPDATVTYGYLEGLRTSMNLGVQSPLNVAYGYDGARRLQSVASVAGKFNYSYSGPNPAGPLFTGLQLPNQAWVTNHYDALARLDYTALINTWGTVVDGYGYIHDPAGLRTNISRDFGYAQNSVTVGYDPTGQVTSWTAFEPSGVPRLNEQLGWAYDSAGNLRYRTNGGLVQSFITDPLNQLTNVVRAGAMTVVGATPSPATVVDVNGYPAQFYSDFTFARTNISLQPGLNTFTIVALSASGMRATNTMTANLPESAVLQYDLNGNLTNDGTRCFAYNAENQLTNIIVAGSYRTDFIYDGLHRKRLERNYAWSGGWLPTNETRFIWDGPLPIQERDGNNAIVTTYTRGLDLSGGFYEAGGIGGLLARTDPSGAAFYHADGNGNATVLMAADQTIASRFLLNPFGKPLGQWGPMAQASQVGFSSMPVQRVSGVVGFVERFYDPNLQRFLNRDPIGEAGGINLYGYVRNEPVGTVDPFGLDNMYNMGAGNNAPPSLALTAPLNDPSNLSVVCTGGDDLLGPGGYFSWFVPGFPLVSGDVASVVAVHNGIRDASNPNLAPVDRWAGALNALGNGLLLGSQIACSCSKPKFGSTPGGRPFTKHYATETGPTRNIPGSVIDNTIDNSPGKPVAGGKNVYYDPNNDVTVVTGDNDSIVSAHKGPPRKGQF